MMTIEDLHRVRVSPPTVAQVKEYADSAGISNTEAKDHLNDHNLDLRRYEICYRLEEAVKYEGQLHKEYGQNYRGPATGLNLAALQAIYFLLKYAKLTDRG